MTVREDRAAGQARAAAKAGALIERRSQVALLADSMTEVEIGERLGVSGGAIHADLVALGLTGGRAAAAQSRVAARRTADCAVEFASGPGLLIAYKPKGFSPENVEWLRRINGLVNEYKAKGYNLTVRQVHYQLVSRWPSEYPNTQKQYQATAVLVDDARMAGLIPWDRIVDRSRAFKVTTTWDSPEATIRGAVGGYRTDKWKDQPVHVECWVEKQALVEIVGKACNPLGVTHFASKGPSSTTKVHEAAYNRFTRYIDRGQDVLLLCLYDLDPSGKMMTRDIESRVSLIVGHDAVSRLEHLTIKRIALNREQVEQYGPPPSFVKETDNNTEAYREEEGTDECWELDALDPEVIVDLIAGEILEVRDDEAWAESLRSERKDRRALQRLRIGPSPCTGLVLMAVLPDAGSRYRARGRRRRRGGRGR